MAENQELLSFFSDGGAISTIWNYQVRQMDRLYNGEAMERCRPMTVPSFQGARFEKERREKEEKKKKEGGDWSSVLSVPVAAL